MTVKQFDNGYWYATELKEFAERIGIPSANKLRKDELERAIRLFLETGKIKTPTKRKGARHDDMAFAKRAVLFLKFLYPKTPATN